jgi:regulator of protease activity HflC (stomatin/prohibitin superfamily)
MKTSHLIAGLLFTVPVFLLSGCGYHNVETPAGYVGYVTQGSIAGSAKFVGTQVGPTSSGLGWLYEVINISVTPYTFDEVFSAQNGTGVLTKDQLAVSVTLHTTFRIRSDKVEDFVNKYSTLTDSGEGPTAIVTTAYNNYIKQQGCSLLRKEMEKYEAIQIESNMGAINSAVADGLVALTKNTPFEIMSSVVGSFAYPPKVADAIADKIAANQELATMATKAQIATAEASRRENEAVGIANAMKTINSQLTPEYIQYEAVKAQLATLNSPNHTVIYIPVGPMGVPITNTIPLEHTAEPAK